MFLSNFIKINNMCQLCFYSMYFYSSFYSVSFESIEFRGSASHFFSRPNETVAKVQKSRLLRDFSREAKKHKNGKCLSITFLCFSSFPRKRSKRLPFRLLQLSLTGSGSIFKHPQFPQSLNDSDYGHCGLR